MGGHNMIFPLKYTSKLLTKEISLFLNSAGYVIYILFLKAMIDY